MACPLCLHPQASEIEKRLLTETNLPALAKEFATKRNLLKRHQACMRSALRQAADSHKVEIGEVLLLEVIRMLGMYEEIVTRAAKTKNDDLKLRAMDSAKRSLDLVAKLTGQYNPAKQAADAAPKTLTLEQLSKIIQSVPSTSKQ